MSGSRLSTRPPLPPATYVRRPTPTSILPFPFGQPYLQMFTKARYAIWHGVRALGLRPGDEVLMPAYHCGLEVEPIVRAGVVCRFYDLDESFEPRPNDLEDLLGLRSRALYLIHYLGFAQDSRSWLRWCRERGLLLIEDAAQAWLASTGGQPLGSFGDLAVFSLTKTLGVPDGGVLLSRRPLPPQPPGRGLGVKGIAERHAAWLLSRSNVLATLGARLDGSDEDVPPDQEYALGNPDTPSVIATRALVRRLLGNDPRTKRQRNYRFLLDTLHDLVPKPFAQLPEDASPFVFPIETNDKAMLLTHLKERGIRALDFWSIPHPSLPPTGFPHTAGLRTRIVGLPVHQELRPSDLSRIGAAVQEAAVLGDQPYRR
jgi:dTDP-4-amino-4,6-dideoxygalactose transaminase